MILFISNSGECLPIAWRMQKEGEEVKVYLHNPMYRNNYDGMLEKIPAKKILGTAKNSEAVYNIDLSGDWAVLESDTEGEGLDPNGWLLAGERDSAGNITLTIRVPHGPNAPESKRFPEPVELANGRSVTFGGENDEKSITSRVG